MRVHLNNHDNQCSVKEYNSLQREYGCCFEKLKVTDRCMILAVLAVSLHNLLMNDPFRSMTTYNLYETAMSIMARDCCTRLMGLTFEHMTCACSALLSQLNLPRE